MTNEVAVGRKREKVAQATAGTASELSNKPARKIANRPSDGPAVAAEAPAAPPAVAPKKAPAVKAAAAAHAQPVVAAKAKLVRDSFTIPKPEYENLEQLKRRALALGIAAKKSELLRAGIAALNAMNDRAFLAAVKSVPSLKTGRPKSPEA